MRTCPPWSRRATAQPDLPAPFQHRDHHRVGHTHPADEQRDRAEPEQQVRERAGGRRPGGESVRESADRREHRPPDPAVRGGRSLRAVPPGAGRAGSFSQRGWSRPVHRARHRRSPRRRGHRSRPSSRRAAHHRTATAVSPRRSPRARSLPFPLRHPVVAHRVNGLKAQQPARSAGGAVVLATDSALGGANAQFGVADGVIGRPETQALRGTVRPRHGASVQHSAASSPYPQASVSAPVARPGTIPGILSGGMGRTSST